MSAIRQRLIGPRIVEARTAIWSRDILLVQICRGVVQWQFFAFCSSGLRQVVHHSPDVQRLKKGSSFAFAFV